MAEIKLPPNIERDPFALAMWARSLFCKESFEEAYAAGLAAVEMAPGNGEVRDLVSSALSLGAAQYHVPMLHDEVRNRAYRRALEAAIRPGMSVLEIGTGAGLLSLIAARAGAVVYTCEGSRVAAAAAQEIARRNGLADQIHVLPKMSSELNVGDDIPHRADLLMSELFDDTFFGDDIVDYIADAKDRLLKPDAPIIPPRAQLRIALIEFDRPPERHDLGSVEGFDMSAFNVLAPVSSKWLRCSPRKAKCRSQPVSALDKDFSAPPPFGQDSMTVDLVSDGGKVSGVAAWLHIDFDGGNVFENDPFGDYRSHWGSPVYLFPEPIVCAAGETVTVKLRRLGPTLLISLAG